MTAFPPDVLVSTPATIRIGGSPHMSVRVTRAEEVEASKEAYGARIRHYGIEASALEDEALIHALCGCRVRVLLGDADAFGMKMEMDLLRTLRPLFIVRINEALLRNINFLSGLGLPTHLELPGNPEEGKALLGAVDFYVHNPLLTTPIEPLHSLLGFLAQGRGPILWDTEYERVGKCFFLDGDGKVSLSRRWGDSGLHFGAIGESWETLRKSALFVELSHLKKNIFKERPGCVSCAHLGLCGGFFRAIDRDWHCDAWKMSFDILAMTVQEAEGVLRRMAKRSSHNTQSPTTPIGRGLRTPPRGGQ